MSIFPKQMAKKILRQVLLDISFLHFHGVIHGNIHTGNILFLAPSLISCIAEEVEHHINAGIMSITWLNRKHDKWIPRYIPMAWSLIEYAYQELGLIIKITDLGGDKLKL